MKMDRYFAVKEMWEDRHQKVVDDLRSIWERYRDAMGIKNYQQMFPQSVEEINRYDGYYHIRGSVYARGCTDGAECKMPYSLVDSPDRDEWFRNLHANLRKDREAEAERETAKQEAQERALLATLQAKYS